MYAHERYLFVAYFFNNVFVWFGYQGNVSLIEFENIPSSSTFWEEFVWNWYDFLNVWENSAVNPFSLGVVFVERFLTINSISLIG